MSDVMIVQNGRDIMSCVIEQVVLARSLQHRSLQETVTKSHNIIPFFSQSNVVC